MSLAIRRAALAYALQFEGAMRQWDVVGKVGAALLQTAVLDY